MKFHSEELKPEIKRWKNALIGSVFGLNPRFRGVENFAISRWKRYGLISVHLVKQNIFMFKFDSEEEKARVLDEGLYTFDKSLLAKIKVRVGGPQSRLGYARLLVEMDLTVDFPESIILEDERGFQLTRKIVYEWRLAKCT